MKGTNKIFDGLLVLEYQSGNKKALSLLVNRYHNRLCKHSYWYTRDIDISKDIVQDCWSIIINKLNGLKEPNSFGSWATKIVTRKSLDFLNNQKRNKMRLEEYQVVAASNDNVASNDADVPKLIEAIRKLPNEQQMVLKLFYIEEYSLKEISNIQEIAVGTVKSRLFHAREKLKKILKTK
ncbi:MAG: RNA polymerase subunit sigma [Flavobacteriaceae bacterium]|nr:MAG: RNA polymerase subunit sigma [Flavobacteriaceae bacterium]